MSGEDRQKMTQVEIDFFWTLTEQIPLDLDFTPCDKFSRQQYFKSPNALGYLVSNGGTVAAWHTTSAPTTTNFQIKPSKNYAGHWEVSGKDFQIFRENRPSWLIRKFNQLLIGWVWVDDK